MKRMLPFILAIILLFLCGCRKESENTALQLTGNTETDPYQWVSFYYSSIHNPDEDASIQLSDDTFLRWNGNEYSITDSNGTRSYQYILYSAMVSPDDPAVFSEYFLLTDDPGMTAEKYLYTNKTSAYLLEGIAPTEVVFERHPTFDLAQVYGDVPQQFEELVNLSTASIRVSHEEDSIFSIRANLALSSAKEAYLIERHGYDGVKRSESPVKGYPNRIAELGNGGFLLFTYSYEDGEYRLLCYQPDGSLHWEYSFDAQHSSHIVCMIERGEGIYCFGEIAPEGSDSDLCIWQFSPEGQLLSQQTFGGSDFDSIDYAVQTADGFTIWGSTQSEDGDLPFSEDGIVVPFLAQIDSTLELISARETKDTHSYLDEIGIYQGNVIFRNDPLLEQSLFDRLPDDSSLYANGIFSWEDGYVIVRTYELDAWPFSNPIMSYQPNYCQSIYTGYDANGVPLWQTVSEPYIR